MKWIETFRIQLKSIFKDIGLMVLLFLGPIFLILFMGGVYVHDYVNDIPMAVLDEDNSYMSRLVTGYFADDDRFQIVAYPDSREALQCMIDDGTVQVGLFIPQDMEANAKTFQGTEMLLFVDGTNLVVANNAYAQATTIIQTVSAGIEIKLLEGKGMTPDLSTHIAKAYNIGERILFDSKMTYMNYLIICFFCVFLQQVYMSAMGNMLINGKERLSQGNVLKNLSAVFLSIVVALLPSTAAGMLVVRYIYHVPFRGNMAVIFLMSIVFLSALTGPALILASLTKDRVSYVQFSLMLSLPTFVSSGAVWPLDQTPKAFEWVIRMLWPLMNYGKPVQEMVIKGRSFTTVLPNVIQMIIYGLVYGTVGLWLYKRNFSLNKAALSCEKTMEIQ